MSERPPSILAGPTRKLPRARAHEIFEERAGAQPDAIAVEHAGTRRTYRELNALANRLGGPSWPEG